MKLTKNAYLMLISTRTFSERYYRDKARWLKVSTRGRTFRLAAADAAAGSGAVAP